MADNKKPSGSLESVGALLALGVAAAETIGKVLSHFFRALIPEELSGAFLTPFTIGAVFLVAAWQRTWKPGSLRKKVVSRKWMVFLYAGGIFSLFAAWIGFYGAARDRVERLDFVKLESSEQGVCAVEGPKTRGIQVHMVARNATPENTIIVCPASVQDRVLTIADATTGVDELGPWAADASCQRIALRYGAEAFSFRVCVGPLRAQEAPSGLVVSLGAPDGSTKIIPERKELKWHERIGTAF
ncbi:hypothetical protein [Stigmatella erecta]|uniref:Uncharacterized protein n=1 Tax=Stigmatella erecta TaxID=83460 RepID=A0A1I0LFL5_9BACT|nr:hypothetical protein [Stigmatella erecta]SEU38611.1 hypothetical protein SAMN05443639_12762 [Stigmatella erecta]